MSAPDSPAPIALNPSTGKTTFSGISKLPILPSMRAFVADMGLLVDTLVESDGLDCESDLEDYESELEDCESDFEDWNSFLDDSLSDFEFHYALLSRHLATVRLPLADIDTPRCWSQYSRRDFFPTLTPYLGNSRWLFSSATTLYKHYPETSDMDTDQARGFLYWGVCIPVVSRLDPNTVLVYLKVGSSVNRLPRQHCLTLRETDLLSIPTIGAISGPK